MRAGRSPAEGQSGRPKGSDERPNGMFSGDPQKASARSSGTESFS